jgi:hypothetical protein
MGFDDDKRWYILQLVHAPSGAPDAVVHGALVQDAVASSMCQLS